MTYSAGIIGTGVGRRHAGAYEETGVELRAVADIDEEALANFGDQWDVPEDRRYADYEAMVANEDLDVVSVCSPSFLHADHAVDVAHSAADPDVIWVEKPIATCVSDAETTIDAAEETDTEVVVNHISRFNYDDQVVKDAIADGLLGDILMINVHSARELMRNGTHSVDKLVYWLEASGDLVSGYLTDELYGLDYEHHVLGEDYDDGGGAVFVQFDNGTLAKVDHTLPRQFGKSMGSTSIYGTEGVIKRDHDGLSYFEYDEDRGYTEADLPGLNEEFLEEVSSGEHKVFGGGAREYMWVTAGQHIVDLLDGEVENMSPPEDATRALEILSGSFVSHYLGSHVSLPLERPLRDVDVVSW